MVSVKYIKNVRSRCAKDCCITRPIPIAMKQILLPKIIKSQAPEGPLMNRS